MRIGEVLLFISMVVAAVTLMLTASYFATFVRLMWYYFTLG